MGVQQFLKRIILLGIVIVIRSQRSSIRADGLDDAPNVLGIGGIVVPVVNTDSDEVVIGAGDSSSEEVVGIGFMSSTAAMFSSLGRQPRNTNPDGCIYEENGLQFCADDGKFYNDTCTINENNARLLPSTNLCELCKLQPEPCPKRTPLCVGTKGEFQIYENECELNKTRCILARKKPVTEVLDELRADNIGNCQEEVESESLTCYEILRGKCPKGTMNDRRVCNTTEPARDKTGATRAGKTYKNICRVLHKRCKKEDSSICFDFEGRCEEFIESSKLKEYDCAKRIWSYDVRTSHRTCYRYRTGSRRPLVCRCSSSPPKIPTFPKEIERDYSLST